MVEVFWTDTSPEMTMSALGSGAGMQKLKLSRHARRLPTAFKLASRRVGE
jgi:hypothetical protein